MITKRSSDRKRILLSVAIAFLVSGCAAATGPDDTGRGGPAERREPTEARGVDPATPTTMMFQIPEPPGSTLSYGGETVDWGLGSYCWTAGGGGGCSDAFAILLGERVLEAPAGATLSFAYGGKVLDSLSATAYRADREARGGPRQDDMFLPPARGGGAKDLPVRRSGTRARIAADLPAGEYVLEVFARMPQGGASYGFRLTLGPRDAAAGDAPAIANVRFEPALPVEELRRMAEEHGVEGGMIQGHYRVGGEVHTWGWAGGFGADFEKERLAPFADITSGDGQMATGEKNTSPETSAVRGAVQEEEAGPKEISGIEFYGPASVLETLIREEEARFSQSNVTTEAALREMLRNTPEGCCN